MTGNSHGLDPKAYKKRLRLLREILVGGNQQDFADILGIPMKRWNNFERGYPMSREVGFMIRAKFPGVSLEWIWFGEEGNLSADFRKKIAEVELLEHERELAYAARKKARQKVKETDAKFKELDALLAQKLRPQR